MLNKWHVSEVELAEWYIKFPVGNNPTIAHIAQFSDRLLEIGEREQVYYLQETLDGYSADQHPSYGVMFENSAKNLGDGYLSYLGYWMLLDDPTAKYSIALSKLAYYDNLGNVVEDKVNNLGALLRALRPEDTEYTPSYACNREPLLIQGEHIRIQNQKIIGDVELGICLYSNIWFPWVTGFLGDSELDEETGRRVLCDNRELASRHTPRLNRFLAEARELTLSMGGKWDVETFYPDMVTENGINLDYDYEQEKNKKLDM